MKACPCRDASAANTPIWQLVILPADPVYCRATPQEAFPCFRNPVSSTTRTASGSASLSTTYSRTISRRASASQRPRPSTTVAFLIWSSDLLPDYREGGDERCIGRGDAGALGGVAAGGKGTDAAPVHAGTGSR